jgi:ABC-type bacteriocin/lantibiotic exporter with double-glycine peptidase domain
MKLIDINSLTFAYECNPDGVIFKDMHFSVNPADKIIIRGRSGSGKTTLYKLLTSAYPHVIDLIESPHLISFSPQHPLSLPDTSTIQ